MSDLKVDGITAATANTAVTIKGLGTGKVVLGDGNLVFPDADGAAGTFITTNGSAALSFSTAGGKLLQVQYTDTGAVATGTTTMPHDDTIPQNTEGDEYLTLAITPSASANRLIIMANLNMSNSNASTEMVMALFQDSTAGALAAVENLQPASAAHGTIMTLIFEMAAGTTSSTTFKIRAGANVGTTTLNGLSGGRRLGGAHVSSLMIMEKET